MLADAIVSKNIARSWRGSNSRRDTSVHSSVQVLTRTRTGDLTLAIPRYSARSSDCWPTYRPIAVILLTPMINNKSFILARSIPYREKRSSCSYLFAFHLLSYFSFTHFLFIYLFTFHLLIYFSFGYLLFIYLFTFHSLIYFLLTY